MQPPRKTYWLTGLLMAVGLAIFTVASGWWLGGPSATSPMVGEPVQASTRTDPGAAFVRNTPDASAPSSVPVALPLSTRGTHIDGRLRVDEDGHLVIERAVRDFFDYMLTGVGEMPLPELTQQIRLLIDAQLQEPARSEAQRLLTNYLEYKTALYELEQRYGSFSAAVASGDKIANLEQRLQAVMALRRELFGETVVDAFFAQQELLDRFTLERMEIMARSDLEEEEKLAKVSELERTLPEAILKQRSEAVSVTQDVRREQQLIEQGASHADVQAFRQQKYGVQAAERLAQLDTEQRHWDQRVERYRVEKSQLQSAGLSPQDRDKELVQLRRRHFSAEEIRRVEALDRLAEGS